MLYTLIKHAKISQLESLLEWFKSSDWLNMTKAVKKCQIIKVTTRTILQTDRQVGRSNLTLLPEVLSL